MHIDLSFTPPIQWERLLAFLAARAAPSVETADEHGYARTVRVDGRVGVVRVTRAQHHADALRLTVSDALESVVDAIASRSRQLLDLDADTAAIESHLANARLAPLDRLRHG